MDAVQEKVAVFLYRRSEPGGGEHPKWGTLEAIARLDDCVPITRSARRIDKGLLDAEGFLPYGLSPDEVS